MTDTDNLSAIFDVLSNKPRFGIGVNQPPDSNGYIKYTLPGEGVKLKPNVTYLAYVSMFSAPNTIQNIYTGVNDKFYYTNAAGVARTLTIPSGYYQISDYNTKIQSLMSALGDVTVAGGISTYYISIANNVPTLQVQLTVSNGYSVDFTRPNTNNTNLGFISQVFTSTSGNTSVYSSTQSPNVFPQNTLLLECDIVSAMFYNNKPSNIMEMIPMIAPSGGNLVYMPNPVKEWTVNKQAFNVVNFRITDQNRQPVLQTIENVIISLIIHQV